VARSPTTIRNVRFARAVPSRIAVDGAAKRGDNHRVAESQILAAVDLGSNSFHMIVVRVVDGEVHVLDRLKERVALAEGLDADRRLSKEARERALACLELFGQRIAHMGQAEVRAVGTNTLRAAKNARKFLERAERALGHPIGVISGREEARLVYLGVASTLQGSGGRRLVVDIGGGSTECIVGEGLEPVVTDSLYMGHISFTKRFFPEGRFTSDAMAAARTAAALEAESIQHDYLDLGWDHAVGSSGTIIAVAQIIRENGWGSSITSSGLKKLRRAIVDAGKADALDLPGLQPSRRPVLAAGVAILSGVFDILEIEEMTPSEGAVREGLIHEMLGRMRHEDVRERTVKRLEERYHVDPEQATRVERTALELLEQSREGLGLRGDRPTRVLRWAARLHEIGKTLSYSGYHKHGAYILEASDMPGFSRDGQDVLSCMVLSHRRKLRVGRFEELPPDRGEEALALTVLLRLAVVLNRPRSDDAVPKVTFHADGQELALQFPEGWLEAHTLTRADLEQERTRLAAAGFELELS
jgi:exopolyphosphatase/guanosine-5'-triphosphate,3'-diphosphate pyrophosphatase